MIGLMSVQVYNSIFNINYRNNKIELYTDTFDEISFEELKVELEEILNKWKISKEHLQDEEIAPRITSAYKELKAEKRMTDGYYMLKWVIIGLF